MKKLVFAALLITFGCTSNCGRGCGYSSRGNTAIGQVKRVYHITPLVCDDYDAVDLSLGVMRNGVGSMSTQDTVMVVPDKELYKQLQGAAQTGGLVEVTFDEARMRWCTEDEIMTSSVTVK